MYKVCVVKVTHNFDLLFRFTQSLRLNSHPEEEEEDVRSLASDGFPSLEKTNSVRKKIAKAFRGTSHRLRRRSYETGSLSGQLMM